MQLFGQVSRIEQPKEVGEKKFKTQNLIIKTVEQYPQTISIQFHQEKTELLKDVNIGQNVCVDFNVNGREFTNDKGELIVFNSLVGWRIKNQ